MAQKTLATVLVVDDNPLFLTIASEMFKREGCEVLTAHSWIEFNHRMTLKRPDLILMDVNLPSIKGNRISQIVKAQHDRKDIPIVLISDLPASTLETIFPSSRADAWLRKPLTRKKVQKMITDYIPQPK